MAGSTLTISTAGRSCTPGGGGSVLEVGESSLGAITVRVDEDDVG